MLGRDAGIMPGQREWYRRAEPSVQAIVQRLKVASEIPAWPIDRLADRAIETGIIGDVPATDFATNVSLG